MGIIIISLGCKVHKDLYTAWNSNCHIEGERLPMFSTYLSKDSTNGYSIWDYVKDWQNFDNGQYTDTTLISQVSIEIQDESSLKLTQIRANKEIDTFTLYGRFENENFVSLQKHKKILIPLIYYQNLNEQLVFKLNNEKNLIIQGLMWNEGAFLFMIGNDGGTSQNTYKKI